MGTLKNVYLAVINIIKYYSKNLVKLNGFNFYQIGCSQQYLKFKADAYRNFHRAIQYEFVNDDLYYRLGILYDHYKQYSDAIICYSNALKISPNYSDIYYNRGNCYFNLNDKDTAIIDYQKNIELNPNDPKPYIALGVAYYQKNEIEESSKYYKIGVMKDGKYSNYVPKEIREKWNLN